MTQTLDPFDELAAMFLTEPDAPDASVGTAEPEHTTSTAVHSIGPAAHCIELLLVGHLPVRGGLWITPYADAVARETDGAVLVRLDSDDPMIQVLGPGPRDETARGHLDADLQALNDDLAQCRTLREAIMRLGHVRHWVIRPSARADISELLVNETAAGDASERVTILSSGNQAAVVNAYGLIKTLVETSRASGQSVPRAGLAVIGCDEDTARQVTRKLNQTTREYLDMPVALVRTVPRIEASNRATSLRTFPGQVRPALDDVRRWIEEARASDRGRQTTPAGHSATTHTARRLVELEAGDEPSAPIGASVPPALPIDTPAPASTPARTRPVAQPGSPWPRRSSTEAPTETPTRAGAPRPVDATAEFTPPWSDEPIPGAKLQHTAAFAPAEVEGKQSGAVREPDEHGRPIPLAQHVNGLTSIAPRCPGHETIELALDDDGRMHLLGRVESMRSLPVVAAWVRQHRELLAMTCPHRTMDPAGRATCHLFCDDPLAVADLHASNITLHVLAPVAVEGRTGWYSAPLNRPIR